MKTLKVLQLASFEGNIGDNANMSGTRKLLKNTFFDYDLHFENLEIREFYWKERAFDKEFISLVNSYDLFIVGGGNYFELWVEDSNTGTSIDISMQNLKLIKIPTIFYSLGCDAGQGFGNNSIKNFQKFLDYVLLSDNFLVSVRNDGSYTTINKYVGEEYAKKISHIADGGFFLETKDSFHPEIDLAQINIGINIAGDMLENRFINTSFDEFLVDFSTLLSRLMQENKKINLILFPHIYKDINVISKLIHCFSDSFARKRITIAPYLHGEGSSEYIFDIYKKCDLILGNRFHSNVCAIALTVPSIGLVNYPQVKYLYEELSLADRFVDVNERGYIEKLENLIKSSLQDKDEISSSYKKLVKKLELETIAFQLEIKKIIEKNS